jgi:tRNA pseudouridine55 synthase
LTASLVRLVNKPRGCTPVEAIERLRAADPSLVGRRVGYAGRLDPLAEGLLVLLVDEANQRAHEFNSLEKEYELEALFGVRTDTYDALGLAEALPPRALDPGELADALRAQEGTRAQPYPPYSAVRVQGRPAFYWARRGEVPAAGWPERVRTVRSVVVLEQGALAGEALVARSVSDARSVRGDFRQEAICARWESLRPLLQGVWLHTVRVRVACSSGTFMRSLAATAGEVVGTGAIALSIRRTRVGPYALADAEPVLRGGP